MKQREYTKTQKIVINILLKLSSYGGLGKLIKEIRNEYKIEDPYLTLRDYIRYHSRGAYHTFHFTLNNVEINIDDLLDMLTDELSPLYPLTKNYYVIEDIKEDNNGNVENYHCDHYLKLAIKED